MAGRRHRATDQHTDRMRSLGRVSLPCRFVLTRPTRPAAPYVRGRNPSRPFGQSLYECRRTRHRGFHPRPHVSSYGCVYPTTKSVVWAQRASSLSAQLRSDDGHQRSHGGSRSISWRFCPCRHDSTRSYASIATVERKDRMLAIHTHSNRNQKQPISPRHLDARCHHDMMISMAEAIFGSLGRQQRLNT